ncbi:FMN-binding glutamate synthase family protein [Aeoliella sp. ICT_H6.2]|uniref:FMN-binding glutamate synthase family protein n=1 Tax=Aeoliella straminimaris TaxID=2954799 RepID=A0A9X2JH71_9BACT|nr:FMN-binding glutamate synthase family protein [Aeoliella straminimaris]MCO6044323.1 FMN-binding glutamate synthase family protein [Aeoliella straminimaris]
MRFIPFYLSILLTALFVALGSLVSPWWFVGAAICGPVALLGVYDVLQERHSILRNYPVAAHFRFLFEMIRPEIHQYFIEDDTSGRPFNRDERSLIYERSKNIEGLKPFGTELDVYSDEYEWSPHSIAPTVKSSESFRTLVGGPGCTKPYSCSLLNVSSMSFGAISPNAILALNTGAKKGGFAHWTGEGGFSPYHRKPGGDVVWQIGTGYFGCRNDDGTFNADLFAEQASDDQVKMIEIKISQGAKPGHGGVLPAAKITQEIAQTRKVPMGQDCVSPPGHSAFHTPRELCEWVQQLRELSGGKPVGFKLCIGMPHEFLAICKAMLETRLLPDFINVDGGEGGTGAAPLEFSDSMGTPLVEGLVLVHNALVGCGLRDKIKIACAGKVSSAADMIRNIAIGADWCNVARGFMMSVGCIQAQACHTNACPVGVATQDPHRFRALNVADKSERAFRFHKNTMETLTEMVAAMGLTSPDELEPAHVYKRTGPTQVMSYEEAYEFLSVGDLLDGNSGHPLLDRSWRHASADTFRAQA